MTFPRLFVAAAAFAAASLHAAFIEPTALDALAVVPPPPAADSLAEQADRLSVVTINGLVTPEQTALAREFETYNVFKIVQPVLGDWATEETLPKFAKFIKDSAVETKPFTDLLKKTYSRPRPFMTNPALKIVIERPESTSYPSGHATASALHTALLAAIWPELATEFRHQAERVRFSRLYAGVHYPSDVLAGQRLGEAIAREMLKTTQTQRAIEEIRAEFAAAIAAHAKKAA